MVKKRSKSKEAHILSLYGLTLEAYDALEQAQNFKCKICGLEAKYNRFGELAVDHDHVSGRVRGLLCNKCNQGLGYFKDNTTNLLRAIQYLKGNL